MEMRYFFTCDQVERGIFDVVWHPGLENLVDYFTKHFSAVHHRQVRAFYLREANSPSELSRALAPRELRSRRQGAISARGPLRAIKRESSNGASYKTSKKPREEAANAFFRWSARARKVGNFDPLTRSHHSCLSTRTHNPLEGEDARPSVSMRSCTRVFSIFHEKFDSSPSRNLRGCVGNWGPLAPIPMPGHGRRTDLGAWVLG